MDADVIVIGAGAAGLAAARTLAERSLRVHLLEARDRVGGRVRWSGPPRGSVATELGAEFIHGPAAETRRLLHEAGTAAIPTMDESWTYGDDRILRREDNDVIPAAGLFAAARDISGDESVDRFLARFANDATMGARVAAARTFVEGFEAADPAIASARAIAHEWLSGVDSTSARPPGGYRPLFDRLEAACANTGVRQSLSTSVRRITWRRGAVAVETVDAHGRSRTEGARAAIVTLPTGVLRHRGDETEIVFEPALPAPKQDALRRIEMGRVVKVALWFRTAFWEEIDAGRYRDAAFFRCMPGPFQAYWTQLPVRSELIVAWVGGPRATALNGTPREVLIERALEGFGAMFGETARARTEFEGGVMHDWDHDPFARGAYSYLTVGGVDARATLAVPIGGTLFFAGEATSVDGQGGTVNGALETGERAAHEAAVALGAEVSDGG